MRPQSDDSLRWSRGAAPADPVGRRAGRLLEVARTLDVPRGAKLPAFSQIQRRGVAQRRRARKVAVVFSLVATSAAAAIGAATPGIRQAVGTLLAASAPSMGRTQARPPTPPPGPLAVPAPLPPVAPAVSELPLVDLDELAQSLKQTRDDVPRHGVTDTSAPRRERRRRMRAAADARAEVEAVSPETPAPSGMPSLHEARLLEEALRLKNAGRLAEALSRLDEFRRRFPAGVLAHEEATMRDDLVVEAEALGCAAAVPLLDAVLRGPRTRSSERASLARSRCRTAGSEP